MMMMMIWEERHHKAPILNRQQKAMSVIDSPIVIPQ